MGWSLPSCGHVKEQRSWYSVPIMWAYTVPWSEREEHTPLDITYMWNLKHNTNEPIYETERSAGTEERLVTIVPQGRRGRGQEWVLRISRCKLAHAEPINNKVLQQCPGQCAPYPVISHSGREHEKEYIYMHICMYVVQSPNHIRLSLTPWTAAHQASCIYIYIYIYIASQVAPMAKNMPANAGDMGSIPELGRLPEVENGNPL